MPEARPATGPDRCRFRYAARTLACRKCSSPHSRKTPGGDRLAGKRTGRTGRERARGAEPNETGRAASPAQIERALTALEELVLAGRAEEIPRWTAVLWSNRGETQRALLRRLETGPVRIPGLYFDVLSSLGGAHASALMRRVAGNREVTDLLRMEARRRVGWPERTERRVRSAFLRTLRDPSAALGSLVAMGCGLPVPDGEAFGEALGYLLSMPADERTALTARLCSECGSAVAWLLRALLSAPDTPTRLLASGELLDMRDRGATAALHRLLRTATDAAVRAATEVAFLRLSLRSVSSVQGRDTTDAPAVLRAPAPQPIPRATRPLQHRAGPRQAAGEPLLPFEQAVVTAIDGNGGQAVTLIRSWDGELRLVVQVFLRDDVGILDAYGMMRIPREQAEEMLRLFGDRDCPLVDVSLQEACDIVLWGAERSLGTGRLPPPAFSLWEPYFFADLCPVPPTEAPTAPNLRGEASPPPGKGVADLLASPFCDSWHFSAEELASALSSLSTEGSGGRNRYGALLHHLCPPAVRCLLASRLRRQAWLLDRSGQGALRDAALGSAVGLERGGPPDLAEMPLLRGMLARGLAALRVQAGTPPHTED